jgi:cytochrome o ubiquinol oxidase operon protein cyoD
MSTGTINHAAGSDHEHDGGVRGYMTGFLLALVLTLVPFFMVMEGSIDRSTLLVVIFGAAVVQVLVHLRYFLHLHFRHEQRWEVFTFVFTAAIVGILISGSVWIMHALHTLLM